MTLSKRWQGFLMMVLAVTLTLGLASTAYAQGRDTGVAVVHAEDPDGAPLPGVMVVMRGPVGDQTQYTGINGSARFPGLYPGEGYAATFTLSGFTTIIRDGLAITANRVIDFTVTMSLATVEETITVTGESPLVDVKSTSIAGLITSDLLEMTPTASGIWAGVLDHVPGVVSSFDVGGGDSGQQTGATAWGSEGRNNTYNINGGDTTDPAAVGASSSYFAVGAFEEISVSMAAQDIEIKTPGVNMNMVVKSGSNDWHAGVKYFYEGARLDSHHVPLSGRDHRPERTRRIIAHPLVGAFTPAVNPLRLPADPQKGAAGEEEIGDPMGWSSDLFRECFKRIDLTVNELVDWLMRGAAPTAAPATEDQRLARAVAPERRTRLVEAGA